MGCELRIRLASLTFCDGDSDESFTAETIVGSHLAYGAIVDPDPVRFVSGCVTDIARSQGADVPEASVGLSMPVSGFAEPDAFCLVLSLPNAMIQSPVMDTRVNVRIRITMDPTYGSGFMA